MAKLGRFQMVGFKAWSPKIQKKNHISQLFGLRPQRATNVMVQLLAMNYAKTLDTLLNQFPVREFENDEEYTWDIIGSARRNIPLVEARRTATGSPITNTDTDNVGTNTTPFYLVFNEPWFFDQEVIVGNLNQVYPMRILGDYREEGTNYVYRVELMNGSSNGIPVKRLLPGERFSVETAYVEGGLSRKAGGIRFAAPSSMRNEWSTIRIHHKVSGDMLDAKQAVGIPVIREVNGKTTKVVETYWMHSVEWELEQQFNEYKNNALAFGRSNRNDNGEYMNFGKSGDVIKTGAGLFEQMEVSNTHYYNKFSLALIEDILYGLSAGKIGYGQRTFVMKTGEQGALLFHKAVTQEVSGWTMWSLNGDALGVVKKASAPFTGPTQGLAAGCQFVEYLAPMGIRIKLDVDPMYDDPVRNKIMLNGKPAMSARFDIFDMGTMDQPNIFKCQIKGKPEARGYQWGLRNPFTGAYDNPHMSYDEDSASFHRMAKLGICVLDPTRTVSLIPNVLLDGE